MKSLLALIWGRTARNSALTIGSNILYGSLIIGFIIITSRILGPEKFGLFSICVAIFGLSFDFLNLGTSQSLIRFVALHRDGKSPTASQFTRAVFILRLIESIAVMAIAVVVAKFLSSTVYDDIRLFPPLIATLALAGGNLLVDFFVSYLQGSEKFRHSAIIALVNASVRIAGLGILLLTGHVSIITVMVAFALGPWIAAGLGYVITPKNYLAVSVPPSIISQLFHFSKWITLWSTTAALVGRVDVLLLGKLTSAYETGIYAAASRLATGFVLIGSSYASVLTPKISRTVTDLSNLRRLFKLITASVAAIILGMIAIIWLAPWVIPITFGSQYSPATQLFQNLTLGSIFFMASIPANVSLLALGKAKFIGLVSILQVTILIIVSLKIIPELGAQGAAIAMGSAYASTFIISTIYAVKKVFTS